jgi:putative ABC transport system permease protein
MVLLTGAGLLIKSLRNLQNLNPGFVARGVTTFYVEVPDVTYATPQKAALFFEQMMKELRTVPGVSEVSEVAPLPLSGDEIRTSYEVEGKPLPKTEQPLTQVRIIDPQYLKVMKIPLLEGREFTEADGWSTTPVVIVNKTLADRAFPGQNPIGKRIKPGYSSVGVSPFREIVGVASPVRGLLLTKGDDAEVYLPQAQIGIPFAGVVMRSSGGSSAGGSSAGGGTAGLMSMVRAKVASMDKQVPIFEVRQMDQWVSESIVGPRMNALLLGSFAGLAVLLAVVGIYGVISYGVSQRAGEFGIRMTLGAQREDVMKMVLGQGLKMAAVGVGIGAVAAVGTNRLLGSLLFGVKPGDAGIFGVVVGVLVGCAVAACWVPARRAMRVSPMEALRYE